MSELHYLDTIGLTTLWSKIKSLFATKSELASKANDSEVIHKSGNETINGDKNFLNGFYTNFSESSVYDTWRMNEENNIFRFFTLDKATHAQIRGFCYDVDNMSLQPFTSDGDLGTSTNKWKTINGINPGMLSFPAIEYIDYSSSVPSGNEVYIEAPADGWFMLNAYCQDGTKFRCAADNVNFGLEVVTGNTGYHTTFCPVQKGKRVALCVTGTKIYCRFFSCQGNV